MKLGEAKSRLNQIKLRLKANEVVLKGGPRGGIVTTLDECSELLREQQALSKRTSDTEAVNDLQGNSLADVSIALDTLDYKIRLLNTLASRQDLDESTKEAVFSQLRNYLNTKDNLESGYNRALWEVELLDE